MIVVLTHSIAEEGLGSLRQSKMLVHGGLIITPSDRTEIEAPSKIAIIKEALELGGDILSGGGSAVDAITAAVVRLEDHPLFNAGLGASLAADGLPELDAMIMDGSSLKFGSVAMVRRCRNPSRIAKSLLDADFCALAGTAAEAAAASSDIALCAPEALVSARAKVMFENVRSSPATEDGTVGAVAIDSEGNLAAAISSGGILAKPNGRLADSCMPGVGAYASNGGAAVSCTGQGETIMRLTVARDIAAISEFSSSSLENAAGLVARRIARLGGAAAFIAIDKDGAAVVGSGMPNLPCGGWSDSSGVEILDLQQGKRNYLGTEYYLHKL